MNKKAIWLFTILTMLPIIGYTQCNQQLVEIAAQEAGADAIYIRDFKVKLSKGTMDDPSPTGKFQVFLNKGVAYRFTIANAREFEGKAIVEVERKGQIYAGNYAFDQHSSYKQSFDYLCDRSASYQLVINYGVEKEGCSAVVMSMIMQDSMEFIEPGVPVKSDSGETIYLWVDNLLQIASSEGQGADLKVTINNGTIFRKGSYYIARPANSGEAMVMVSVIKNSEIVDSDTVIYLVNIPPLPEIELPGESGGTLAIRNFRPFEGIHLNYFINGLEDVYQLEEFIIVTKSNELKEYYSVDGKLSSEQINLIRDLQVHDRLIISKAVYKDHEGNKHISGRREILIVQ
ncbi:MAG: hypothetical protein JXP36_17895 [Bacteroidales bacterium]|nr:hypothetical protein [Bacteroidales bacterium]MBN2820851.1 hypothetical protein [Bacteroidales bacterium]